MPWTETEKERIRSIRFNLEFLIGKKSVSYGTAIISRGQLTNCFRDSIAYKILLFLGISTKIFLIPNLLVITAQSM